VFASFASFAASVFSIFAVGFYGIATQTPFMKQGALY